MPWPFAGDCGCLEKAYLGWAEASLVVAGAATGPYASKPRTGVAGGGAAGNTTSYLSKALHEANKKWGKNIFTKSTRFLGRLVSRIIPYVGSALLVYDTKIYSDCIKCCR